MAQEIQDATYTLTRVVELREWEEAAECYMSILPEQKVPCDHCGKLCQRFYEVTRDQDGSVFNIGPGCCNKNLFGWEPEKQEAKRMEKAAAELAKNKGYQRLVEMAMPIVDDVAAMIVPQIVYKGTRNASESPCYGMEDSKIEVICREGLTEERIDCCVRAWKGEQAYTILETVLPRTENAKKWYKVAKIVEKELWL